jgi:hypothetical protein
VLKFKLNVFSHISISSTKERAKIAKTSRALLHVYGFYHMFMLLIFVLAQRAPNKILRRLKEFKFMSPQLS